MWAWWGKQFHEPKYGSGHICRVMAWTRQQSLVPYIGSWERPKTSSYLTYIPPTHEYGTRPFLRWVQSQGRSPHASGKAKNTVDPVGIPLFGAPQAPGNNPPTKGVKTWGDGPLRQEELSSAESHPAEPPRGKTANRMQPNNWGGKIRRPLEFCCRWSLCYMKVGQRHAAEFV